MTLYLVASPVNVVQVFVIGQGFTVTKEKVDEILLFSGTKNFPESLKKLNLKKMSESQTGAGN